MQLDDVFLAKFAELGPDGLFTVVGGGVDRINVGALPWSWGFLYLLARVRLTTEEAQGGTCGAWSEKRHTAGLSLSRKNLLWSRCRPRRKSVPDGRVGLSFIIYLVNLIFTEPGVYKYRFKIDGREFGVAELLVAGPAQGELIR